MIEGVFRRIRNEAPWRQPLAENAAAMKMNRFPFSSRGVLPLCAVCFIQSAPGQGTASFAASPGKIKYTTDGTTLTSVAVGRPAQIPGYGALNIAVYTAPAGTTLTLVGGVPSFDSSWSISSNILGQIAPLAGAMPASNFTLNPASGPAGSSVQLIVVGWTGTYTDFASAAVSGSALVGWSGSALSGGALSWLQGTGNPWANPPVTPPPMVTGTGGFNRLVLSVAGQSNSIPWISTQPASVTAAADSAAGFWVAANGGALSYQWRKAGASLAGATGSSLGLSNLTTNDAGNYDVVVSNPLGSVTSVVATLTVITAPIINQQPSTQTPDVGGSAGFSVGAEGAAPLAYQWRKGGLNIPGANGSNLSFVNVTTNDTGSYDVIITNSYGYAVSVVVRLTIPGGIVSFRASPGQIKYSTDGTTVTSAPVGNPSQIPAYGPVNLTVYTAPVGTALSVVNGVPILDSSWRISANTFHQIAPLVGAVPTCTFTLDAASGAAGGSVQLFVAGWTGTYPDFNSALASGLALVGWSGSTLSGGALTWSQDTGNPWATPPIPPAPVVTGSGGFSGLVLGPVVSPSGNMLPPTPTAGGVLVRFAGLPGRPFTLQRAQSSSGPWSTLTTVTVGLDGFGAYQDNGPPSSSAFYRTVYP
jgi:hypothetical protein